MFLATIEGTGSALLLYVMLGVALMISLPVHGCGDPRQILAAVAGIVLVAAAFALLSAVARDGRGLRRLIAWLARWVPGMNADTAAAALRREAEHLRALAADPPRLVAAVAWGAANWLLDAAVLWGVLAAVGHTARPAHAVHRLRRGERAGAAADHARAAWAWSRACSSRRSWPRACPRTSRWSACWAGGW